MTTRSADRDPEQASGPSEPDFLDDSSPRDGSRSVTSSGAASGPLHHEPAAPSHGQSLATPGLGSHVMDDSED